MLEELRKQVYEANMELPRRNLVTYTWGNVSGIDREKGLVVIKPSGVEYDELTPENLVVLDLDGNRVEGELNPSSDTKTHLELYKAFPTLGGIVHTHSPYAVAWPRPGGTFPATAPPTPTTSTVPCPCARHLTKEELDEDYEKNTGKIIIDTFTDRGIDPVAVPGVICHMPRSLHLGQRCGPGRLPRRGAGRGGENGPADPSGGLRCRPGAPVPAGQTLHAQTRPQRILRAKVTQGVLHP